MIESPWIIHESTMFEGVNIYINNSGKNISIIRIKIIPPLGLIFEPPVKPGHDGSCPDFSFIIGHNVVILLENLDIFHLSPRVVILSALNRALWLMNMSLRFHG